MDPSQSQEVQAPEVQAPEVQAPIMSAKPTQAPQQQQPMAGGRHRPRRSRKPSMWAKAAGEYYRSHKNDPKIKSFSDVLKSPDFKAYYASKYGKGQKRPMTMTKKRHFGKRRSSRMEEEQQPQEEQIEKTEETDINQETEEEYIKPKKGKKVAKSPKEESGWTWGGRKR